MLNLTLSQEQAQSLLELADAAVRSGGLRYVRHAVFLMDTLDHAAALTAPEEATTNG